MQKTARHIAGTLLGIILTTGPVPAPAQEQTAEFGRRVASVTYGPYIRLEQGHSDFAAEDGYWLPPGVSDPRIDFDLDGASRTVTSLGFGYDWMNGYRAEATLLRSGRTTVTGPCSSASDGSSCSIHATITGGSVRTNALMGTLFYSPLEQRGSNSIFQPFLVAGLGFASNRMSDWTRTNLAATRPVRSFSGDTNNSLAWSVGAGMAIQLTRPSRHPVIAEIAWRYYDFGKAEGSATPLSGASIPRQPLNYDVHDNVISFAIRVPLRRY